MATRRCKKSGRLKRRTKSGRKCRKISKCRKGRLKTRKGRRQCRKSSKRKSKRKYRMVTKYGKPYPKEFAQKYFPRPYEDTKGSPQCADLFDYLVKLNLKDDQVTELIKEGKLPKNSKRHYASEMKKLNDHWKKVNSKSLFGGKNNMKCGRPQVKEFAPLKIAQNIIDNDQKKKKKKKTKAELDAEIKEGSKQALLVSQHRG